LFFGASLVGALSFVQPLKMNEKAIRIIKANIDVLFTNYNPLILYLMALKDKETGTRAKSG